MIQTNILYRLDLFDIVFERIRSTSPWSVAKVQPSRLSISQHLPSPARYFSHSLTVSFPFCAFLETRATQANVSTIKVTSRVFVLAWYGGDRFGKKKK